CPSSRSEQIAAWLCVETRDNSPDQLVPDTELGEWSPDAVLENPESAMIVGKAVLAGILSQG
ncbi:MAG: hypothetical protein VX936_15250, partial [Planctomycetota bacterium]|nr:hypothetical protein [Planctomycetota bacterium]